MKLISMIAIVLAAISSVAKAELPPPPPPHDPSHARCGIERFIGAVNRRDFAKISTASIFEDEIGQVSAESAEKFFKTFDVGTKLSDRDPLSVSKISVLDISGVTPIYLASIERRYSDQRYWSVWLFLFKSNEIILARRADELWPLLDRGTFAFVSCGVENG